MLTTAEWIDPLIAGLAGVLGALVGAGALLFANYRTTRAQRDQERRDAFVGFYSATNSLGLIWFTLSDLPRKGRFARAWFSDRAELMIVNQMWSVMDTFWEASARARGVASTQELAAIEQMERVIGELILGEPMPQEWGPAIREVRALVAPTELRRGT